MESGESSETHSDGRKRTDSSSGNSDSDFSDGWNIVDHVDVHNTDGPSSDGESVDIIDTESAFNDDEEEYGQTDGKKNQLLLKPEALVVPSDQGDSSIVADQPIPLYHEDLFNSSFCWFLFFAVSAVLLFDVSFMVAESVLDWNVSVSKPVNQPSFLSDLPVTPKVSQQKDFPSKITWTNEEVTVHSAEISNEKVAEKIMKSSEEPFDRNHKYYTGFNENTQQFFRKNDDHDVGRYLWDLSEVTVSNKAQNKFSQTLLVLDALHIGLKDLEGVVSQSSELHQVLREQKKTLVNVLAEIQSGLSRSLEKMATNVLDRVQRLERNFEIQLCRLEKAGHKVELKGLFYECLENDEKHNNYNKRGWFEEKSIKNDRFVKDSYQYEVDRDSTGKEYNRYQNIKENNDYYDFVKNERNAKQNYDPKNKNEQVVYPSSEEHLNPHKDEKPASFNELNKLKNEYNQSIYGKNKEYENENKQTNHDNNAFNNEKYNGLNQKYTKHENSKENNNKQSERNNFDKIRKYSKAENKVSENEDLKRNDQTKTIENHRSEDKKFNHYEKSEKYEGTISKNNQFGNDENLGNVEHVKSENKYSDNFKHSIKYNKNDKLKMSKNHNNYGEKLPKMLNDKENKFDKKYNGVKYSKNKNDKYPTSDESTYPKTDYVVKQEPKHFTKVAEKLGKYLKEKCDKNRQKTTDLYNKIKEGVKEKMKVPLEIFNSMFSQYCSAKENNKHKDVYTKEQLKGEYKRKDRTIYFDDEFITVEDNASMKNGKDLQFADSTKGNVLPSKIKHDNSVELPDKRRQWTFVYENPSPNNESEVEGDWFIKSGESRSKARWTQRRSDWLFERASHRRGDVRSSSYSWFVGRRKNWFFRRAWAREQCRETPDSYWCHPAQDEAVTLPGSSFS